LTIVLVRLTEAGEKQLAQALKAARELLSSEAPVSVRDPDYEPTRRNRQAQHRLTPDEVDQIGKEYRAGMSIREIAMTRKLHRETAALAVRRAGVPTRKVELSEIQLSEAASLYAEGWSLNQLGKRYGVDPKTIKKRL
jgi:DNA-binding NarL/FixJ family response regulator